MDGARGLGLVESGFLSELGEDTVLGGPEPLRISVFQERAEFQDIKARLFEIQRDPVVNFKHGSCL